ncbi:MAG: AAA family ATPase [Tenericutes bacterium]|nr:AAA family ATPase [Mycoplasmatota bacterium]
MYKITSLLKVKKLIAIEGEPASGKTTLANFLQKELDCNVVSVDDFYLPIEKRNELSFLKGGNNIDFERLIHEVILKHLQKEDIVYKGYDCKINEYEETKTLKYKEVLIIEGSYCLRVELLEYFDYKILMEVDSITQLDRLKLRPNFKDFLDKWIPLSNNFIKENNVTKIVDKIIKS